MKKNILCSLLILGCLALYTEFAIATIVGSQHDLTEGGGGSQIFRTDGGTEICVFCHTPHGGNITIRGNGILPLWNRTDYAPTNMEVFTMYTSATFTAQMAAGDGKPTGYSLMCLSCHDGVSSIGWVKNNSSPGGGAIPMNYDRIDALVYSPHKNVNIGRDLTNDHPISIRYNNDLYVREGGATGALKDPTTINSALRLYGSNSPKDFLECPTCHDPHEYGSTSGKAPFLRMSNDNSDMCLACHNK